MRVHALEITAFGPFADTVRIDVDALSAQGLFLLTGPTGAGKTSVLDAICFGLYGRVPGARQQADRLRSDHAEPAAVPRVRLEVTLGGRRLRIVRSPRWQRPSARARAGQVAVQATVTVQERPPGGAEADGWVTLTTRIDEAQLLVDELLGMTLQQFTQVAMLPQGAFQDFLRSGTDERRVLLERLFGTARFRDVERWLVDRRQRLRVEAEAAEQAARSIADQVRGAAHLDRPVPDRVDDWPDWSAAVRATARRRRDDLTVLVEQSRLRRDDARQAYEDAVTATAVRRRGEQAQLDQVELARTAERATADLARLDAADRAREVAVLLDPLAEAAARLSGACSRMRRAAVELAELAPGVLPAPLAEEPDDGLLALWSTALEAARTDTDRMVEREQRLVEEVGELAVLDQRRAELADAAAAARDDATALRRTAEEAPGRVDALRRKVDTEHRLDAAHDHLATQLAAARARAEAATALPSAERRRRTAEDAARGAYADYRAAVDTRIDVTRRRLAGAAGELAQGLVDDAPCCVCGSRTHPDPAAPTVDHPGAADERAAADAERHAEGRRDQADRAVTAAAAEVSRLTTAAAGLDPAEAATLVTSLTRELTTAAAARRRLPKTERELLALSAVAVDAVAAAAGAAHHARDLRAAADGAAQAADTLRARLVRQVGPGLDVAAAQQRTARRLQLLAAARAAVTELRAARSAHAATTDRAARAAVHSGFDSVAGARAALLDAATRDELRSRLETRRVRAASAAAVLADPSVRAALAAAPPDTDGLAARVADAEQTSDGQQADLVTARRTAQRVAGLHDQLADRLADWRPRRQALELAAGLAGLAEGKSADNDCRMSLSSYVLAARLEQVVAAANERLQPITSGRYLLEHTVQRAAGDRRAGAGGLGLLVRDEWTGDLRDPSTLSGGETFQASLSLALGLADVVGSESGGTELHTVFVDEGFGALDPDSLDEVMDELDRLRDGGRVVGVVSHVDAMRERIPAQLRLAKTRSGSRVSQA